MNLVGLEGVQACHVECLLCVGLAKGGREHAESLGIGASELGTVWIDPDFDPKQKAFYYARVIEIPTPRWSTYDAFRMDVELPADTPTSTQERAYTSPIWYAPKR